ncbi:acyl-CoA dehydrogenase [Burkholderia lata]|uniref:acyl-CoA dehydrogenase n=1 Tax=Burkholderia lata (strain ATCC 17760 / DSM 23089 / LMG 22485 / NCIMB 9086 / R18194 / 383) TaxID=482957 RepID=UPI0014540873|nr:acyl-CoA dehydrogenase family protein [Burkholderia lata]VWB42988.1 acyl-CoA dehydrogenase [Burkholderia lata]
MNTPDTSLPATGTTPVDETERAMLRSSVRRQIDCLCPPDQALSIAVEPLARAALWQAFVSQGLAELGDAESGTGLHEAAIVAEETGRAACPVPFIDIALANFALGPLRDRLPDADDLLSATHAGTVVSCVAVDRSATRLRIENGALSGEAEFVEGARDATHLVAIAEPGPVLAIVPLGAAGVRVTETPGLARPPLAAIGIDKVPALSIPITTQQADDFALIAGLMLVARSLGAARRGFELALDHAKERRQFGQPIGRFQALQHKLANGLIALEATRLLLYHAADSFDRHEADWRLHVASTQAFANPALRQVAYETQHVLGAIGFSEEHEAPRHFRRVHADLSRFGGARHARQALAHHVLDDGNGLPEHDLGPAGNAFRDEVRTWLAEHWAPDRHEAGCTDEWGFDRAFTALLGRFGWNSLSWPVEHGGQARTPLEQLAFMETLQLAGAPMGGRGDIQAHALIRFGTPEQQREFLPKLASGDVTFCLGYSEPGAGSDLASLRTTAVRDGDEWVINGRKIWTTAAELADYMWLAARTDPNATPPHAGISIFIVPMNAPGLSIRPSDAMYGYTFCEETFDDVRIPASALVGNVNEGWKVITSALATERITMGSFIAHARAEFEHLVRCVREGDPSRRADAAVRERLGTLAADVEAGRHLFMQSLRAVAAGGSGLHEAAITKAYTGELLERLAEAALDLLGPGAGLAKGAAGAIGAGRFEQLLYAAIPIVVGGGTAEIQRNVIAQRGLGLPR